MIVKTEEDHKEARKKNFFIVDNKGFHIMFKNKWKVSVQFGWGNYCDNYNNPPQEMREFGKYPYASNTAEVWAFNVETGKNYPKEPLAYQTPEEVLKFINKIARKK